MRTYKNQLEESIVSRIIELFKQGNSVVKIAEIVGINRTRCSVVLNENGLVMYGYHHDGTNVYTFYKLNNKGVEYWEKHEDDYDESKILQNLIRGKMVKKITKDMIGY